MGDIDHFEQINDLHGHDAGDQLLKAVGDAIRSSLRPSDLPCRYGGEEFLLMLADVDGSTGSAVVDAADVALYAAKNKGRNQTRVAATGS